MRAVRPGIGGAGKAGGFVGLVGILICRWTLHIPILAPAGDGAWGNAHTAEYALVSALAAVVYPFSTGAPVDQKAATAIVDLVLGIAIISLLTAVAARAVRRPVPPAYGDRTGHGPERGYGQERAYPPGQDYRPDPGYVPEPRGNEPTQPIDEPYGRRPRRY